MGSEPTAAEVREQLRRMVEHRDFEASDRTRRFLHFVVEETLAGRGQRLKGYVIAVEVFGRQPDFDANLDPIVRIQAGRLRRALEHYYLVAGGDDPIVIAVPRGTYMPVFTRKPGRFDPGAVTGSLPLAASRPAGMVIAVLPFRSVAETNDLALLADSLSEELCDVISLYESVGLVPCRRGSAILEDDGDYAALSRRTGARFLIDGSVQRDGAGVKISVRLVDGQVDRQIWTQSYHRAADALGLVELTEAVARSVAGEVVSEYGIISQCLLAEARHSASSELTSFEAVLMFYEYEAAPNPESAARCLAALQATVTREPTYGPAWSALSVLMHNAYMLDLPDAEDPRGRPAEYARRGALLAPRSQLARAAMAQSDFVLRERESCLREIEAALHLNPASPLYLGTAGYLMALAGEHESGRTLLESAISMNPAYPSWFNHGLFVSHYVRGDYGPAFEQTLKAAFDIHFWGPLLRAAVLGRLGRFEEARAEAAGLVALVPGFESRARDLVSRPILSEPIVDGILGGLRLAGLRL